MHVRRLGIAAGLAVTLVASGCGTNSKALSQAQYQQQLGSICANAEKSITSLPKPTTANQLSTYVNKVVEVANTEVSKMGNLKPPKAEQAKLSSAVAQAHSALDAMKSDLGNVANETPTQMKNAITKLGPAFDKVGSAFSSAGAPASCSSTTGGSGTSAQ
jgi:Tfp pilus assembly protein PilP